MKRDLRLEMRYPHPPERVWRALTDREALASWLMPNTFEGRVGHRFEFRTRPGPGFDGIVRCEVTVFEPPRHLAYTWRGGPMREPTVVSWTLEPDAAGTRVVLEHRGFVGVGGVAISHLLGGGWRRMLGGALALALDRPA